MRLLSAGAESLTPQNLAPDEGRDHAYDNEGGTAALHRYKFVD